MRMAVHETLRTCLSPFCSSSVYKQQCPLDIYKGCNVILQCIHKAVNHHSTCTCLLLLMWFFCPSALTAAPLLIESSHDKIKAFYCCAFFCHKAPPFWKWHKKIHKNWSKLSEDLVQHHKNVGCQAFTKTSTANRSSACVQNAVPGLDKDTCLVLLSNCANECSRVKSASHDWAPAACAALTPLAEKLRWPKKLNPDWLRRTHACANWHPPWIIHYVEIQDT